MNDKELNKIISTCKRWNKSDLPSTMKSTISHVILECENELLRSELNSLGYKGVVYVNTDRYYCLHDNCHYHKHIVHWSDRNSVSWLENGYSNPIVGKFYVEISFSTGAYYIGGDSDGMYEKAKPFFREMWDKVVAYKPDSLDMHNFVAFFEIHRKEAVEIWNNIDDFITIAKKGLIDYLKNDRNEQIRILEERIKLLKESE